MGSALSASFIQLTLPKGWVYLPHLTQPGKGRQNAHPYNIIKAKEMQPSYIKSTQIHSFLINFHLSSVTLVSIKMPSSLSLTSSPRNFLSPSHLLHSYTKVLMTPARGRPKGPRLFCQYLTRLIGLLPPNSCSFLSVESFPSSF